MTDFMMSNVEALKELTKFNKILYIMREWV